MASKKVGFQLPKNKGEITTLYRLDCQVVIHSQKEIISPSYFGG